ncbi:MAG: hypothetical protein IJQ20_06610 [Paludibacteraceae bacterium]|nr:hypothetical protein [Paludibacteraceae bacterium]
MIKGKDLILEANGTIAAAKSCEIGVNTDFIETANPENGSWKDYLPTINSWDASVNCLMAKMEDVDKLFDMQKAKQKFALSFFDADMMSFYQGYAYIKNLKVVGSTGSLATMTVSFQTTGELKRAQAQALNIKSTTDTYEQTTLDWTGSEVVVRSATQQEQAAGDYVIAYEFTSTVNTRVTALYKSLVVKGDLETIGPMIVQNKTSDILAASVLVNSERKEKSVVATANRGSLTLTMIMNYNEAFLPYQFITLKKQITQ